VEGRAETHGRRPPLSLPAELSTRRLARRALAVVALLVVAGLVAALAPGLDEVRARLTDARPGWLALALGLELLSGVSYVAMFRPVFCPRMSWRTSWEIAWSELAVGSLVPASGAGGLALGAWILRQGGMPVEKIARRSVAFFLVKSSINFVAVAVVGTVMALGLAGPQRSLLLTALPAAMSVVMIAAVVGISRLGHGAEPAPDAARAMRLFATVRRGVVDGAREAVAIVRSRNVVVLAGAIGYWAFDNAVLWAAFHAFGASVPLTVVLMGYLIGQLGGLLPIPGGVGGIDGGLIGTLIVYGIDPVAAATAVLAYRVVLFWIPIMMGAPAFWFLRRGLEDIAREDLCLPEGSAPMARVSV